MRSFDDDISSDRTCLLALVRRPVDVKATALYWRFDRWQGWKVCIHRDLGGPLEATPFLVVVMIFRTSIPEGTSSTKKNTHEHDYTFLGVVGEEENRKRKRKTSRCRRASAVCDDVTASR